MKMRELLAIISSNSDREGQMLKNERAFTLIEMMIVLLIISILLLVTIPNVTKNNTVAQNKGCEALVNLIEAQVQAYEIEHEKKPDNLEVLREEGYIKTYTCPNGDVLQLSENGEVQGPNE